MASHSASEWQPAPILPLAARYAAAYLLFALLAKAMPTASEPAAILALLPGFALGFAIGTLPNLRRFRTRAALLAAPPAPPAARWSGLAAALIAITTLLIYRVDGVTILLALLLMRGGVLAIAPLVDRLLHRPVTRGEAAAVALSLAAVAIGLSAVGDPGNRQALLLLLPLYLAGNGGRLLLMLRHAKRPIPGLRASWLVSELQVAALTVALVALALTLRLGLPTPLDVGVGIATGLAYAAVLGWGSAVYLDPASTSLSVVVNRGASMLAGIAASLLALPLLGQPLPGAATWLAGLLVLVALLLCARRPA